MKCPSKILILTLSVLVCLSLYSCESEHTLLSLANDGRPPEAYIFPDFSGEVTDVRVSVREREYDVYKKTGNNIYKDVTFVQLYYGYQSDGKWIDLPAENYALQGICRSTFYDGWEATQEDHAVRIGPYILLMFPVNGNSAKGIPHATITDTLDSEVNEILDYYCPSSLDGSGYSYFAERMEKYGTEYFSVRTDSSVDMWYYVILREEDLSEDYSITVQKFYNETELNVELVYTYRDIMQELG